MTNIIKNEQQIKKNERKQGVKFLWSRGFWLESKFLTTFGIRTCRQVLVLQQAPSIIVLKEKKSLLGKNSSWGREIGLLSLDQ